MKKEIIADRALAEHIADLAKLTIDEADSDRTVKDMRDMIAFANRLSELDCYDPLEVATPPRESRFREDTVGSCLSQNAVLSSAKTKNEKYITVPKVIEA